MGHVEVMVIASDMSIFQEDLNLEILSPLLGLHSSDFCHHGIIPSIAPTFFDDNPSTSSFEQFPPHFRSDVFVAPHLQQIQQHFSLVLRDVVTVPL